MSQYRLLVCAALFFLYLTGDIKAQNPTVSDEQQLLLALGDEDMISIAAGHNQPVARAPSVATVITAEDIKSMGATTVSEALESVPGLHVARRAVGYNPKFLIRGVETDFNPQVLVLINGIPITNIFHGDRNQVWGGMPVEAISRIEIIRGPGSAVLGADAVSGVINIITKIKKDIPKPEFGLRLGRFSTREAWFLGAETWEGFDFVFSLEYHESDGHKSKIKADQQTQLDPILGTNVSLAPGSVNLGVKRLDSRLDISKGDWRLRAGLQRRWDVENGAGVAQALDPNGRFSSDRWNVDLTYNKPDLTENWDVKAQFSFLDTSQEVDRDARLFPTGAVLPVAADGNLSRDLADNRVTFADGVIGNPDVFERHYRFELSSFYAGLETHHLRLGTGFNYSEIYKVRDRRNFGRGLVVGTFTDVSDTGFAFLPEEDRSNFFAFAQDEWSFANDWTLTTGVRYDHYSDFGDTVNPRVALIWATSHDITTKLLYGQAIRAPAFAELFERNNPVAAGNSGLDPEMIQTMEIVFDYRPSADWRWDLNLFYYKWEDIVRFAPDAQNSGEQTGYGLELEADWQLLHNLRLVGNYAFQKSEDEQANKDSGNAPHHQAYFRAEWEFLKDWSLSPQLNAVIDRERPPDDNRSDIDDYAIVDLTLRRRNIMKHFEMAVSVRNLFDEDAREPSPSGNPTAAIPNDLPLAERSVFVEVRLVF